MNCWKCRRKMSDEPMKIGYRTQCPFCDSDLHVCFNCRFYSPGKPNDCAVPGTDWVKDRDRMNLCDEFSPLFTLKPETGDQAVEKAKKLLQVEEKDLKKGFLHLFKDRDE